MENEKKLIERCINQDSDSQKQIYISYSPILMSICMRYLRDKTDAEDALQEGFITIFTKIKQYKGSGSFEGWMKRIIVNTSLMFLRRRSKDNLLDSFDKINEKNLLEEIHANENEIDIRSIIQSADLSQQEIFEIITELPEGFRTIFNLFAIEGYKHKEIADMLGISENTSKSQLLRARKKLMQQLYDKAMQKKK